MAVLLLLVFKLQVSFLLLSILVFFFPTVTSPAPAPSPHPPPLSPLPSPVSSPKPSNISSPAVSPSPQAPASSPSSHPLPHNPVSSPLQAPAPVSQPLTNATALDPSQLEALRSLSVPIRNPGNICQPSPDSPFECDQGYPTRHLVGLTLEYCPETAALSKDALVSLSTLKSLAFRDCPMAAIAFPLEMTSTLESLSIVSSLGRETNSDDTFKSAITGVWLSRFHRLARLEVRDVVVNASGLGIILSNMTRLQQLVISNTTLGGRLLRAWPNNLTTLDLSNNRIQGNLPSFFGQLQHLELIDLNGNNISGHLPESLGHLHNVRKISLGSNAFWGSIPKSFVNLTVLDYLDLSNNKINGTIPDFIPELPSIRYLDLTNNNLNGILPLNTSVIQRLNTFKVEGNPSLCFNSSSTSSKLVRGLAKCDDMGNPIVPSSAPSSDGTSSSGSSSSDDSGERHRSSSSSSHKNNGTKKTVWAIATALGAIFLFIVIIVALSRWCKHSKG